jgi:hypothetical protein
MRKGTAFARTSRKIRRKAQTFQRLLGLAAVRFEYHADGFLRIGARGYTAVNVTFWRLWRLPGPPKIPLTSPKSRMHRPGLKVSGWFYLLEGTGSE